MDFCKDFSKEKKNDKILACEQTLISGITYEDWKEHRLIMGNSQSKCC